jgi:hypothetical protein
LYFARYFVGPFSHQTRPNPSRPEQIGSDMETTLRQTRKRARSNRADIAAKSGGSMTGVAAGTGIDTQTTSPSPCGVLTAVMDNFRHTVMFCVAKEHRDAAAAAMAPKGGDLAREPPVRLRAIADTTDTAAADVAPVDVHTAIVVEPGSMFHRREALCSAACTPDNCYRRALHEQRDTLTAQFPRGIWWVTETVVPRSDPVWEQLNECVVRRIKLGRLVKVQAVHNMLQRCAYSAACATRARISLAEEASEPEMLLWHGSRGVHPMCIAVDPRGVDPSRSRGGLLGTASYFSDNPMYVTVRTPSRCGGGGVLVACQWRSNGVLMAHQWRSNGVPVGVLMAHQWRSNGVPVGVLMAL